MSSTASDLLSEELISISFSLMIFNFLVGYFSSVLGTGPPALYFSLINVFTLTLLLLILILRLGALGFKESLLAGERGFDIDNRLFSSSLVFLSRSVEFFLIL